jgi:hypothetical protein
MEMPSSTLKEQLDPKSIEPVIPCRQEAKVCETPSALIPQLGDRKPSSNIVDDLIVVLYEMVKDGESPKGMPDWKLSDLVADSITVWGFSVPFDLAIRNLMQTGIDVRIPIFKACLPKAIKSGAIHHVKMLLLLVPNVDDLDGQDTELLSVAINAAVEHKFSAILLKWLTNTRRSIEDFGVSVRNPEGKTPLHLSVHSADSLEAFLTLGVRIDIVDNNGNTCIHLVVPKDYPCIAKLLKHKTCTPAIVNIRNREGLTAYHLSLKFIRSAIVRKWFLEAGADPNLEMPKGKFRDEVVAILKETDWVGSYVLDDSLVRELQGTARE